jgi:DNA-binding NtrC family response regulator
VAEGSTVKALIAVDDPGTRQLVQQHLQDRWTMVTAFNHAHAHELLESGDVDLVIAGVAAATTDGGHDANVFCHECARVSDVPIAVVLQSAAGPASAQPITPGLLLVTQIESGELARVAGDLVTDHRAAGTLRRARGTSGGANGIIAESLAMGTVMAIIERAAVGDSPVLLLGESGTGKDLLAHDLHRRSLRANGPFVVVNCSAIPETLLENELFGHRQGAFTDARRDQRGLFQAAHRGTIFLDEIGDMAPALQGKLLRVLQEKVVCPLGGSAAVPVDARVIAATHRNLEALVADGRFRHDLLYRIKVIDIHVPPLRDRPEDIPYLIAHFLDKHGARLGRSRATVAEEALALARQYAWPGNVRELENVIERALALGTGPTITARDLPEALQPGSPKRPPGRSSGRSLADVERDCILSTLRSVEGNKSAAARVLGVNRKTLYRKLGRLTPIG